MANPDPKLPVLRRPVETAVSSRNYTANLVTVAFRPQADPQTMQLIAIAFVDFFDLHPAAIGELKVNPPILVEDV